MEAARCDDNLKLKDRNMKTLSALCVAISWFAAAVHAAEFHVALSGNDSNPGTKPAPFRTIQHAADAAQPGDVVTVHAGVYRERIDPPRGGTSDARRITYQAAAGEKVVITGAEPVNDWEKVGGNTWQVTIPNRFFGKFNPYADLIHGDWFSPNGRSHHTGAVYLNGGWLTEAAQLDDVLKPAGATPLWFAKVDGADSGDYLLNIEFFTAGSQRIAATACSAKDGELHAAACSEGGNCMGWIRAGSWLKFDQVNLTGVDRMEFRAASVTDGGDIEIHLNAPDGELIGTGAVSSTGDWQKWATFTAKLKPVDGVKTFFLVFKPHHSDTDNTTIWAQFPGVNPNQSDVEINVRQTVFTPTKTGINYLTVARLHDARRGHAVGTANRRTDRH